MPQLAQEVIQRHLQQIVDCDAERNKGNGERTQEEFDRWLADYGPAQAPKGTGEKDDLYWGDEPVD